MNDLRCPHCGQTDMVQKVNVVYEGGFSTTQHKQWVPPPPGTDWAPLLVNRQGLSQTALSAKLAPPKKPTPKSVQTWNEFRVGGIVLGVLAIFFASGGGEEGIVGWVICMALAFLMFVLNDRRQKPNYPKALARWQEAMRRWNSLYYCARDDGVFVPGEGHWYPANSLESAIWGQGP